MNDRYQWSQDRNGYQTTMTKISYHINKDMVTLPLPGNGSGAIHFKHFKESRGSGYDILYWTYSFTGPGKHKTTYTIWNK